MSFTLVSLYAVSWRHCINPSDSPTVSSVDGEGNITALAPGFATIKIETEYVYEKILVCVE